MLPCSGKTVLLWKLARICIDTEVFIEYTFISLCLDSCVRYIVQIVQEKTL